MMEFDNFIYACMVFFFAYLIEYCVSHIRNVIHVLRT